jgi:hypothetical protein
VLNSSFVISLKTAMFEKLPPPDTATSASLVIAAAMPYLHPVSCPPFITKAYAAQATHTATVATVDEKDHHVLVDCNEQVKLVGMQQYQESSTPEVSPWLTQADTSFGDASKLWQSICESTRSQSPTSQPHHRVVVWP